MSEEGAADWTAASVHSPVRTAALPTLTSAGLTVWFSARALAASPLVGFGRLIWGRGRFRGVATGGLALGAASLGVRGVSADAATYLCQHLCERLQHPRIRTFAKEGLE